MTSLFSWQNSVSFCLPSFCTPRPNLPVTLGVSWLPTFAFQSAVMKRTSFGGVSSRRSVGLHRTVQLLQRYWSGHRLGLLWHWMVCCGNEQRSFCHFWDCIQVLFRTLVDCDGYTIFSNGLLPMVLDTMVIWVKFTHSSPFGCFPGSSVCKESACSAGDPGSIPGLGRSPGEGSGNPLHYSCL